MPVRWADIGALGAGRFAMVNINDVNLVKALIPNWYATRRWAEELLCRSFGLNDASELLRADRRGRHRIPGTTWYYSTHGAGVNIGHGLASGGIDFDFDKPDPDAWRLEIFAEKQLNAGNLPDEYFQLLNDVRNEDRFAEAAKLALK